MIAFACCVLLGAFTVFYVLFLLSIIRGIRIVHDAHIATPALMEELSSLPFVTILLPVRNEEKHIRACLHSLLAQQYPDDRFEIIVLDDASEDATTTLVELSMREDSRVRLLTIQRNDGGGKKVLISRGVAEARGEIIVTTDADCTHDARWLLTLVRSFDEQIEFLSAPVIFHTTKSFLQKLIALEFLGLVGVGAGFIGIGYPKLCNGANIAFRKRAFDLVCGYDSDDTCSSGDDEFLMQKIFRQRGGVAFNANKEAIVITEAPQSLREFFEQRKRWASKGLYYRDAKFVAFLLSLFLYFTLMLLSPFLVWSVDWGMLCCLLFLLVKWISDYAVLIAAARLLRQRFTFSHFIIAEIFHIPYIVLVSILGSLTSFTWKDRKLKS